MRKKRLVWLAVGVLVVAILWVLWGNLTVGLTQVTIHEDNLPMAFHGYRIAQVSDLHNSHLWKQTIKQLKKAQPDMICITGDLVDSRHPDINVALAFCAEAVKIAPCYYVPGNHENGIPDEDYELLVERMEQLGVKALHEKFSRIQEGDEEICLVGLAWSVDRLNSLQDYDGYRILLAHHPEYIDKYMEVGFDLVLSGHTHGGQFRVPFLGGLVAPGQGILPHYDAGHFQLGRTDLYISRGIGNSRLPLRLNNRPEVILITLKT
jgi:predicted MPP superfamily phosphohydrolase